MGLLHRIFTLFIGFVFFFVCGCNKQTIIDRAEYNQLNKDWDDLGVYEKTELYYWSSKKKFPVIIDSTSVIVEISVDSGSFMRDLQRKVSDRSINATRLRNSDLFLLSSDIASLSYLKRNKETVNIKAVHPSYKYGTTLEMVPTGEIVLKLKSGGSIQNLLDEHKESISLVKTGRRNKFTLRATNLSDVLTIANRIYEDGEVEWCHPDFIVPVVHNSNDDYYGQQYYLNQASNIDINAPEAWNLLGTFNVPVRVAVIDDGVEPHIDLPATRVLSGYTPRILGGNGAPVNINRHDYVIGHGQAVAGIIGATRDNNEGIAGIADNVEVIPVNIFADWYIDGNNNTKFYETPQDIAEAIRWAWEDGEADILNNSWTYSATSIASPEYDIVADAILEARTEGRNGKGTIVVFSSGNYHPGGGAQTQFNGVAFPANLNGVITVGGIDQNGNIWNYSSRGSEMDLVAPTGGVYTTDRMGAHGYNSTNYTTNFGGTSAAAPQVSGVAALMLTLNPNLTESSVRSILQQSATDMGSGGFDNTYGYGRVDAYGALVQLMSSGTSIRKQGLLNPANTGVFPSFSIVLSGLLAGKTVTGTVWSLDDDWADVIRMRNTVLSITQVKPGFTTGVVTARFYIDGVQYTKSLNVKLEQMP